MIQIPIITPSKYLKGRNKHFQSAEFISYSQNHRKMKKNVFAILTLLVLTFFLTSCACKKHDRLTIKEAPAAFDHRLAEKLGADDYGMRKYVMAFLKSGPNRSQDAETRARLQRAHLDNIKKLANEGKLVLAGPFLDDGSIRGIYIFAVESLEEARKLTETDPAIIQGSLEMELHPWYGSAALMEVNEIHNRIEKLKI